MELERAKKQVEYFVESLKNDTVDIFINNVCNTDAEAIETVLQGLDKLQQKEKSRVIGNLYDVKIEDLEPVLEHYYISKKKIEDKITYWNKRLDEDERLDWIIKDKIIINVLQQLLEGK